jgi:(E)-4-hydroxy-3-methylbut-2-enyl-diphosphate synthase
MLPQPMSTTRMSARTPASGKKRAWRRARARPAAGDASRASRPGAVAYTSGAGTTAGYPHRGAYNLRCMASQRQIHVGGVPIGGGAPVVVQTMTKTETANLQATMDQIRRVAEAGADIVRVAVPRDEDVDALKTIVAQSPIPVIADIHFNHTLALKALDAGAHCVRINPGNIGGPDKVAAVVDRARELGTPLRIGVNSGSLPKHLRELEFTNPVEALVTAAVEFVELMERLDFTNFKVSMKSTSVPNTIASNRMLAARIPYPLHLGITEAGTKWSGSLKSAVGLGTLLADGIGDTIRISLSTFQAEEEVRVAWEILKALKLRERGPVLIACPTCGRLQFDMDTVVAEIERRLEAYDDPIEVSVLGCAVNGIGEARHADFGITGAKNEGLVFSKGEPLRKVPQDQLVDVLFEEIDKYYTANRTVVKDARAAAEGAQWLAQIEAENAGELTPERLAALEEEANEAADGGDAVLKPELSPVAGRRFSRA